MCVRVRAHVLPFPLLDCHAHRWMRILTDTDKGKWTKHDLAMAFVQEQTCTYHLVLVSQVLFDLTCHTLCNCIWTKTRVLCLSCVPFYLIGWPLKLCIYLYTQGQAYSNVLMRLTWSGPCFCREATGTLCKVVGICPFPLRTRSSGHFLETDRKSECRSAASQQGLFHALRKY